VVALPLFAHVAQGVFGGTFVEFVQDDQFGVVQHVDFLELALGTKFRGHDIAGEIDHIDDFGIGLANTGGFYDDQVKTSRFEEMNGVLQHGAGGQVLAAGGH